MLKRIFHIDGMMLTSECFADLYLEINTGASKGTVMMDNLHKVHGPAQL